MMDPLLKQTLNYMERLRSSFGIIHFVMDLLRSLFLGLTVLYIWAFLRPTDYFAQALFGLLGAFASYFMGVKRLPKIVDVGRFLKALEVKYPLSKSSAFLLMQDVRENMNWKPYLEKEKKLFFNFEKMRLRHRLSTLVWPLVVCLVAGQSSPGEIQSAIEGVQNAVAKLSLGADLTVIDGIAEEGLPQQYSLSTSEPVVIKLLDQNMLQVTVVSDSEQLPYVSLKPKSGKPQQTFRLTSQQVQDTQAQASRFQSYQARFSVTEDSEMFLSTLSISSAVATIDVESLPVPRVDLSFAESFDGLWPDDKPLKLVISVSAENPLQQIRLSIRTGGQSYQELVSSVLANDKYEIKTEYSLLLESYVRGDIADVEVVAEAVDRAMPAPLIGRSEPLIVRVASAYGRYRNTLQSLRKIKQLLDRNLSEGEGSLSSDLRELVQKAIEQSENSPYFDGLDRHNLRLFRDEIENLSTGENRLRLMSLIERLNNFLFEHETLDDRERDRDFFVAARTLSRIIEQKKEDRKLASDVVVSRMSSYLDERLKRWALRVSFLGDVLTPESWNDVKTGQFQKALQRVQALDEQAQMTKALNELSGLVSSYKNWIEELERREDKKREQLRQKQQKGLADARNNLKELQRQQGRISEKLDRAGQRPKNELLEQWPSIRMEQNSNVKGTKSLEAQLRSLSPMAAERIEAARKSMQQAVEAGNQENFTLSESAADLAGRLLRQADNAAQRSQRQQQNRGRRRRISSDQYFGTPVAGGDVEIRQDYRVDPRYREHILDQVRRSKQSDEQSSGASKEDRLLESYLRKIIR